MVVLGVGLVPPWPLERRLLLAGRVIEGVSQGSVCTRTPAVWFSYTYIYFATPKPTGAGTRMHGCTTSRDCWDVF